MGPESSVEFEDEKIEIDIDPDGVTTDEWVLTPENLPVVSITHLSLLNMLNTFFPTCITHMYSRYIREMSIDSLLEWVFNHTK